MFYSWTRIFHWTLKKNNFSLICSFLILNWKSKPNLIKLKPQNTVIDLRHRVQKKKKQKLPRPATLLKKRLWDRCFPVNFCKISKNTYSYRASLMAASVSNLSTCSQGEKVSDKSYTQYRSSHLRCSWTFTNFKGMYCKDNLEISEDYDVNFLRALVCLK